MKKIDYESKMNKINNKNEKGSVQFLNSVSLPGKTIPDPEPSQMRKITSRQERSMQD